MVLIWNATRWETVSLAGRRIEGQTERGVLSTEGILLQHHSWCSAGWGWGWGRWRWGAGCTGPGGGRRSGGRGGGVWGAGANPAHGFHLQCHWPPSPSVLGHIAIFGAAR